MTNEYIVQCSLQYINIIAESFLMQKVCYYIEIPRQWKTEIMI